MNREIFCKNSIGLLILAGGKSERMGRDKAGLVLSGSTFAETLANNMGSYDERLFSSGGGPVPDGFSLLRDEPELAGMGPMAGIATALLSCKSRALMVVPCDCPFMDSYEGEKLAEAFVRSDVPVIAVGERGAEPLIGIYPKDLGQFMRNRLLAGERKALDILEKAGFRTVETDRDKLININTPEDYIRYGKGR